MWTRSYKGHFIHGYCHTSRCQVQFMTPYIKIVQVNSLHAAKLLISQQNKTGLVVHS